MVVQIKRSTIEEFDDFVVQPENVDKLFEFISGEIIEKMPSNAYASKISSLIIFFIQLFLREHGIAGHVTGESGGYMVSGERYAPDVAYISKQRQLELAREGYNPNPPELAVEVEYPTSAESERRLRAKLLNYMAAGTLLWIVYPETQEVEIYAPGQPMKIVGIDGALDGGDILPGFELSLKEIFEG